MSNTTSFKPRFKLGDIVHLKSGGPNMTILEGNSRAGSISYIAGWFTNGEYRSDNFEEYTLLLTDKREFEPVFAKTSQNFSIV